MIDNEHIHSMHSEVNPIFESLKLKTKAESWFLDFFKTKKMVLDPVCGFAIPITAHDNTVALLCKHFTTKQT